MSTYDYQASSDSSNPDYNSVASPRPGGSGGTTYDASNSVATPNSNMLPSYNYDLNSVNPMTDLQYLSFQRGMGLDASSAQAQAAYNRAMYNTQLQSQIPQYEQQRQQDLTSAGNQAAAGGNARSSAYLTQQNHVNTGIDNSEINLRNSIAAQQGQSDLAEQQTLAGLQQQDAEQQLAARQQMLGIQNQNVAYQRAIQELGYTGNGF